MDRRGSTGDLVMVFCRQYCTHTDARRRMGCRTHGPPLERAQRNTTPTGITSVGRPTFEQRGSGQVPLFKGRTEHLMDTYEVISQRCLCFDIHGC